MEKRYTTDLKQKILDKRNSMLNGETVSYKDMQEIDAEVINEEIGFVMGSIVDCLNSSVCEPHMVAEAMFKGITNSHRYLQACFWDAMRQVIEKYADTEFVDERNQYAKDMCGRFVKGNEIS